MNGQSFQQSLAFLKNSKPEIHLVIGPSSVGKSTYISKSIQKGIWNIRIPILYAYQLERNDLVDLEKELAQYGIQGAEVEKGDLLAWRGFWDFQGGL